MHRWLVSVAHAVQESMKVVEPGPVLGLASPAFVHEVVELPATARRGRTRDARVTTAAAPLARVGNHLVARVHVRLAEEEVPTLALLLYLGTSRYCSHTK